MTESLDDLYDQRITVAQLRRLLTAYVIASQGFGPRTSRRHPCGALAEITGRSRPGSDENRAALILSRLMTFVGLSAESTEASRARTLDRSHR